MCIRDRVNALDHGDRAAASIRDYVLSGEVNIPPERRMQNLLGRNTLFAGECLKTLPPHQAPATVPELDPGERIKTFDEVDCVISKETAYAEANRCLRCYRLYSVVTEKQLKRAAHPVHRESIFPE